MTYLESDSSEDQYAEGPNQEEGSEFSPKWPKHKSWHTLSRAHVLNISTSTPLAKPYILSMF